MVKLIAIIFLVPIGSAILVSTSYSLKKKVKYVKEAKSIR
jgi:hypothetical protein